MPNDPNRPLKVFLCHAHADRESVRGIYARLKREGVDVWLDKEKLLPGADWEYEIRKAVRESDVVVVCLSKQFNQAGFRQKEVKIALDAAMEKPEGEIFIIPARLEECDNLDSLSKWHWVDLFESDGFQRLMLALRTRANKIGAALRQRGHATISRPKINADEKARLEAEELERQRIAREKTEQEALEKARLETEKLARQKAAHENAEKADRERKEKEAVEKARREAEERAKQKAAIASEPKLSRKPNTAIIVAIIGLVGTICAALVSSPMLTNLFSRTPEPTPSISPTFVYPDSEDYIDDKGIPMRLVFAGEFTMGSETYNDEKPTHQVYLDAFYMDKYEVTNALYKACVDAGECDSPQQTKSYTRSSYYGNSEFDNYPVIYVDWNQAKAYCEWRNASLPTEAQWEKAARGTDGRTYPWGEGIDSNRANYNQNVGDTTEVGSYESGKSPYGIYDMAGNVWEWVNDWYDSAYYQSSPSSNPSGPSSGTYRVLRGGSWFNDDNSVRSANRDYVTPVNINDVVGFRCARSLP